MSPRIVVDALSAQPGGGLSYLQQQLPALEAIAPDLELTVLTNPSSAGVLRSCLTSRVESIRFVNRARRMAFEQVSMPAEFRRATFYCPGNFAPHFAASRTLLVLQNPNYFGRGRLLPHNRTVSRRFQIHLSRDSVRRAGRTLAISSSLRSEVVGDLPGAADRVGTLLSGAPVWPDHAIRPASFSPLPNPYLLSIANDAPHKRIDDLVTAWASARRAEGTNCDLVLAGRFTADRLTVLRSIASGVEGLVAIGGVGDRREVRWLYENASAMVSTSVLEAHPLTPAEAGSLGCPLILSDIPPHREVAVANATYVAPRDTVALADAITAVGARREEIRWEWPITWETNATVLAEELRRLGSG